MPLLVWVCRYGESCWDGMNEVGGVGCVWRWEWGWLRVCQGWDMWVAQWSKHLIACTCAHVHVLMQKKFVVLVDPANSYTKCAVT